MRWQGTKPPLAVEIEISTRCNRKCPYCPNSRMERPEQGDMDPALFERILAQLADLSFQGRISFHFYNEPLVCPSLEPFVMLTRERLPGCRIEIFTNGTLLNAENLPRLLSLGVDKFTVTRHVGADLAAFEHALAGLSEELKKRVVYKNHDELIYTSRGGLVPGFGKFDLKPPLKLPCFVPFSVAIITVRGNVLPCFEDYLQQNVMGNVSERHFGDIWSSPKYVEFRERLKKGERHAHCVCRDCDYALVVS